MLRLFKAVILVLIIPVTLSLSVLLATRKFYDASGPTYQSLVRDVWLPENAIYLRGQFISWGNTKSIGLGDFQSKNFTRLIVFRSRYDTSFTYLGSSPEPGTADTTTYSTEVSLDHGSGVVDKHEIDLPNQKVYFETNNTFGHIAPQIIAGAIFVCVLVMQYITQGMIYDARKTSARKRANYS